MTTVAAVVLAAGGSRRLGRPKQLLPYRGATLLDATLATARASGVDQVLLTVGGSADEVRDTVGVAGVDVVPAPDYTEGCAASIRAAVRAVRADAEGLVVLLGDQPGSPPSRSGRSSTRPGAATWDSAATTTATAIRCGSPAGCSTSSSPCTGTRPSGSSSTPRRSPWWCGCLAPVPPDVDTWEDYQALLASAGPEARP